MNSLLMKGWDSLNKDAGTLKQTLFFTRSFCG